MLAALIPVSDSLRETGATDVIAAQLASIGSQLPGYGALGLILVTAMAITPFLNNAATVLVMAPIAAGFASGLGYRPEAFLMAVAIGAGCDFLTPIGHQCNTLVMGPGGYRFGDYARLGLALSIIVALVATPLLMVVWPLQLRPERFRFSRIAEKCAIPPNSRGKTAAYFCWNCATRKRGRLQQTATRFDTTA